GDSMAGPPVLTAPHLLALGPLAGLTGRPRRARANYRRRRVLRVPGDRPDLLVRLDVQQPGHDHPILLRQRSPLDDAEALVLELADHHRDLLDAVAGV